MLSLRGIRDAAHVEHYFRMDDLTVEGRLASSWNGQWAATFRLEPPVRPEDFRELLLGRIPGGIRLGRPQGGRLVHAPGFDATFSAPKSVSVAALVWGDRRLVDAHDRAVCSTLKWIETEHCYFRKCIGGVSQPVPGVGLLAATFRHGLSRLADPQLHSHAVILNFTGTDEGKFRSLHGLPVFNAAKLIGAYYRLELAASVQAIGYALRKTRSGFELAEVPPALLRLWSKRSRDIENVLEEKGSCRAVASGRQKQYVTLLTRPPKTPVSWEVLSARWSKEYETSTRSPIRSLPWHPMLDQAGLQPASDRARVATFVECALAELDAQYGCFRRIEFYARVFERALGEVDAVKLWRALGGSLESMTRPVAAPGWTPVSLGSDWRAKRARAFTPRFSGLKPPVYLAWGSVRAASLDMGILEGREASLRMDPRRLESPLCLIEVEPQGSRREDVGRYLLFYLPAGASLGLIDSALERAEALGVSLALLEVPRREFGLMRTPGKHHLENLGLAPEWLRFDRRDAFLRERVWRTLRAHERGMVWGRVGSMRDRSESHARADRENDRG
ncbi:MAG: MobF family relaxase [Gammaproteobacteria bacterium]